MMRVLTGWDRQQLHVAMRSPPLNLSAVSFHDGCKLSLVCMSVRWGHHCLLDVACTTFSTSVTCPTTCPILPLLCRAQVTAN